MKKTFYIVSLLACVVELMAQQLPLFTQYREYHSLLNPAAVCSDYMLKLANFSAGASVRTQWLGTTNNPKTQVLRSEWVIPDGEYFSFITGGHLINDQASRFGTTGAYGRIAGYFSNLGPQSSGFSAGLNIGAVQYRLDAVGARLLQSGDVLADIRHQRVLPDLSLGIFGYHDLTDNNNVYNILYGGLSALQALRPDTFNLKDKKDFYPLLPVRHYYGQLGFYHTIDESFIEFSSWFRYVKNTPFQIDFNFRGQLGEKIWLGVGYSTSNVAHLEIGYIFDLTEDYSGPSRKCKIGFGTDIPFNMSSNSFRNSFEVNLAYLYGNGN